MSIALAAVGLAATLSFYAPFVLHEHFASTLSHLETRSGQGGAGLHASVLPWLRARDVSLLASDAVDLLEKGHVDRSLPARLSLPRLSPQRRAIRRLLPPPAGGPQAPDDVVHDYPASRPDSPVDLPSAAARAAICSRVQLMSASESVRRRVVHQRAVQDALHFLHHRLDLRIAGLQVVQPGGQMRELVDMRKIRYSRDARTVTWLPYNQEPDTVMSVDQFLDDARREVQQKGR